MRVDFGVLFSFNSVLVTKWQNDRLKGKSEIGKKESGIYWGWGGAQVDYGRRFCCQETAGTRDAGLLGNRLNATAGVA